MTTPKPRLRPGDRAPSLALTDATGASVELASLWARGTVALVFLRHFG